MFTTRFGHICAWCPKQYNDADQTKQMSVVRSALERLRALPGVQSAAITRRVPLNDNCVIGTQLRTDLSSTPIHLQYECNNVGPDYFRTIGIPILRGREFTAADGKASQTVAIVNETFARTVFGKTDPVGRTIATDFTNDKPKLIVGVAKDSRYFTLGEQQRLAVYQPYFAYGEPINLHFLIRTAGSPAAWVKPITDTLGRLDSTAAIETKPMSRALGLALLPSQAGAVMLGAMGILGLMLAAIGLYGVLLFSVSRRTREIGLRVALGATPSDVLRIVGRKVWCWWEAAYCRSGSGLFCDAATRDVPGSGPEHSGSDSHIGGNWRARRYRPTGFLSPCRSRAAH